MKKFIIVISIVLLLGLSIGAISKISSNGSFDNLNESFGDVIDDLEEVLPGDSGSIETPEKPEEPEESVKSYFTPLGGNELLNLDFENIHYSNSGKLLFENNINSSLGGASKASACVENGKFNLKFDSDSSNTDSQNAHFAFGITVEQEKCYDFSKFDYLTVDMDFTVNNVFERFNIYAMLRQDEKNFNSSLANLYAKLNGVGGIDFTSGESVDLGGYEGLAKRSINSNSFHLTVIFEFNHSDLLSSLMHFYIDGVHLFSDEFLYDANFDEFCTIRTHLTGVTTSSGTIEVDNVKFYTFGNGSGDYDGALIDPLFDTSINLSECSDSVLYEE